MTSIHATIGDQDRPVTVYEAHSGRLPPVGAYIRDTWARRRFVVHMASSNLKAAHTDNVFGQLWQVLNPLLLGLVYFFLVFVIRGGGAGFDYLSYLMGGLFLYFYVRRAVGAGANAIVTGGGLMLNSAFPRAILPLSTTMASTLNYLPSFLVYLAFHVAADKPLTPYMLLLPILLLPTLAMFVFGLSMLMATLTVYFRDTSSFLPYVLRIWLYLSPVLLTFNEVRNQLAKAIAGVGKIAQVPDATIELAGRLVYINPMVAYLEVWHALVEGHLPDAFTMLMSVVWAIVAMILGGWYFLSREREFAFRV